jgi:CRP-like cAMP-binding protein
MPASAIRFLAEILPQIPAPALADLEAQARVRFFPAEITLCHEGEVGQAFFLILEGRVDVYKLLEGQRLHINQLEVGAHFGEIALLLDRPRTATIITAEPTTVLEIDRTIFAGLVRTNPEVVVGLSQLALRRMLAQNEKHLMEIARLKKRGAPPGRVFISYARADAPFATRLANSLLKQNIDVWIDTYRLTPGRSWARQIGEALDACQVMIVVLSPPSVASENVEDEWNYYLDQKKPTLCVRVEPCKVPYRLSKLQYIDFHETDFDQALARVLATLNTLG